MSVTTPNPIPANPAFLPVQNARFADNEFQNITERTFRDFAGDIDKHFVDVDKLNTNMVRGSVFRVKNIIMAGGVESINTSLIPPRMRILGMDARAINGTDATTAATGVVAAPIDFRLIAYPTGTIDALVDELSTTTATVKARWVRTSGTDEQKQAYFEALVPEDHPYLKGEVVSYVFPNGATRLLQWRANSTQFTHPVPTGLDDDPIFAPFALLSSDTFVPVLASELVPGAVPVNGLGLHAAIVALANAYATASTGTVNTTPAAPAVAFDTTMRILSADATPLATSELEYRHGSAGAVTAYAALSIDGNAHAAAEWQFRVKAATVRNVSAWADSPAIGAAATGAAFAYNVLGEGHSRMADERDRYYGDQNVGPIQGTANPWLNRLHTAYAGNTAFGGWLNFATAGDDIPYELGSVELGEVTAGLIVGKVNILFLHNYINSIHSLCLNGTQTPQEIALIVQQRIQDYITAIKAAAATKGAELRIIQFTEPSTEPSGTGITAAQIQRMEGAVNIVRNWLRVNYRSIDILVLADLCSEPRFLGLHVSLTSPYYLSDAVHYSPPGHQYICDTFAGPALLQAAANTAGIVEVINTSAGEPVVVTTVEDADYSTTFEGWDTESVPTGPGSGYSADSARLTFQGGLTARLTRAFNLAGTPEEYIEMYVESSSDVKVSYQVDGGAAVVLPAGGHNRMSAAFTLAGLPAGTRVISVLFENITPGVALVRGSCNFDRWVVASRVPIGGSSGPVPGALNTTIIEDTDPLLTLVGWTFNAAGAPYSNGTTQLSNNGGTEATVATPITVTGTPEEGAEIVLQITPDVVLSYKVDNGAWVSMPSANISVSSGSAAMSVKGLAAGTHTITFRVQGSPLPYGSCNFDYVRLLTR